MESLKLLLIAYACRPGIGSEPEVGWQYAREIASYHEVWLLTRSDNAPALSVALEALPPDKRKRIHIVYHDVPRFLRFRKPGQRGYELTYYFWLLSAIPRVQRLHREVGFDIAHHLTVAKYTMFSPAAFLGIPFVWGPVGGGETSPPSLIRTLTLGERFWEWVRLVVRWLGEIDPLTRKTARRAQVCLATTPETASRVRALGGRDVRVWENVGLSDEALLTVRAAQEKGKRHLQRNLEDQFPKVDKVVLLSAGRLLGWKGFHLVIMALAQLVRSRPNLEYWLVGEGPYRTIIERLVENWGLKGHVRFFGYQKREELLKLMTRADIFIFPSFHDSGGFVLLEAMAAGLPIVCLDAGGPGQIVTPEVGIKVSPTNPKETIDGLVKAIRVLSDNPELRLKLAQGAQRRVEQYAYRERVKYFCNLYEEITQQHS